MNFFTKIKAIPHVTVMSPYLLRKRKYQYIVFRISGKVQETGDTKFKDRNRVIHVIKLLILPLSQSVQDLAS